MMVPCMTCDLCGGLGNQLFQIFVTISYAIKYGYPFRFIQLDTSPGCTFRVTYWNTFLCALKPYLIPPPLISDPDHKLHCILETNQSVFREFDLSLSTLPENCHWIQFRGYFQSYVYFQERQKTIFEFLQIQTRRETFQKKLSSTHLDNVVAMHFRRGDFKHLQHIHPILKTKYYINCLHSLLSKYASSFQVLYFFEKEDREGIHSTIQELQQEFPSLVFTPTDHTEFEDWEEMLWMSLCHYMIIANSTFSWWAAYFNDRNDKIVYYPSSPWFLGQTLAPQEFCPPEWIPMDIL